MFSLTFKVSILFKSSFYFHYRKGRIIAYNTADRIVVDSRISRMVFRNYTRFDEVFILLDGGESQRQTRGKQNLERRKLLSLRRNLNGSIRCRRKDRLTPKHIHIQEIRLQRISHPPVGKRKMISIFFLSLTTTLELGKLKSLKNFRQN